MAAKKISVLPDSSLSDTDLMLLAAQDAKTGNASWKRSTLAKVTEYLQKVFYKKSETDTALEKKLNKVTSDIRIYPGVYATESTDGTPQLITATSDLSYIGTGSGYIPLYAPGGQLKTAEPTSDDSAANKEYVDGKASTKQDNLAYRLFKNLTGKNYLDESTIKDGYYGSTASDWNVFTAESNVKCLEIELEAGTYTASCQISGTTAKFVRWAYDGVVTAVSGDSFVFSIAEKGKVYITWKSVNTTYTNMKTMIELGGAATSYEPYIPAPGTGTSYKFITPESFGAKGDGVTDDTAALNACFAYANESLLPVYCFGSYNLGSAVLNLFVNNLQVYIHEIKSNSSDCCIKFKGKMNTVTIDSVKAPNGHGIIVTNSKNSDSDIFKFTLQNYLFVKKISSKNHCFYKYSCDNEIGITYNTFEFLSLGSSNGDCIRDYGGGGNNTFNGNNVYCYAENGYGLNIKSVAFSYYTQFVFELNVKNGILCEDSYDNVFDRIRSRELADKMRTSITDSYYTIEFKGNAYGNKFNSRCDYISVKNTVNAFNAERAQAASSDDYWDSCLRFNGTNVVKLDRLIPYSYSSEQYRLWAGSGEIITYFGHTGIKLEHDVPHDITTAAYKPFETDQYVPTVFNIKANTTITLNDMYFPLGISEITVIQNSGKTAIVKDRHGNTVFDGALKGSGIYKLQCVIKENDTATGFHLACVCFTGENDAWIECDADNHAYELIEEITLTEVTDLIERSAKPDGTAYSFAKVLITVDTPKTDTAAQQNVRLYINDGTLDYYAYYQSLTTYAKRAHFDCVVDNGVLKIRIGNGATNYGGENTGVAAMIENANVVFLSAINKIKLKGEAAFAVGTIIKIYGVKA